MRRTDGRVALRGPSIVGERRTFPSAKRFCTSRTWDQRAETGFMKDIEDAFQPLAAAFLTVLTSLSVADLAALTKFFAL